MRKPSDQSLYAIAVLCVCAVAITIASAAPAPKTPPDPDHLTGTLDLDGPVLYVPNGDEQDVVWLVFRHEFGEDAALSGFWAGDRVTVRGKAGAGGVYRYLVVAEVTKAD